MISLPRPHAQPAPGRLIDQVNDLRATLARDRIHVTDMSRAASLEMGIGLDADPAGPGQPHPIEIVRLEGPIVARSIESDVSAPSRVRFFLDGVQKTMPICRVGLAPVVVALAAAGVLYRNGSGQPALMGDLLRVQRTWIAPRHWANPELDSVLWRLEVSGETILDPTASSGQNGRSPGGAATGDYSRSLAHAYDLAGRIRHEIEQDVLGEWERAIAPFHRDEWIVVDGRLGRNVPNAIGIVKELQTQLLTGNEAIAVFDMPKGHRSTAFRYVSASDGPAHSGQGRTMWYMRLWNATGMDARHSMIRVEAPNSVATTDEIDEISRWILAERLPRATEDPRWPTLLYPIHYLERILKRRVAAITAGWPSA